MEQRPANHDSSNIFFPNFNFNKTHFSPELPSKQNGYNNFSPLPEELRSPILGLNFAASPHFRFQEESKLQSPEYSFLKEGFPHHNEPKFKPKLNSKIQRRISLGTTFPTPAEVVCKSVQTKTNSKKEICSDAPIIDGVFKEILQVNESTIYESHWKSQVRNSVSQKQRPGNASLFDSASDEQTDCKSKPRIGLRKPPNELRVRKLLKMQPLFLFFLRYFNDRNWIPDCNFEHFYELQILKALLKPLGFKNPEMLNTDNFILSKFLSVRQKSPVLARNVFNFLMRVAFKRLKSRFLFNLRELNLTNVETQQKFLAHYFAEISDSDSNFSQFDFFEKGALGNTKIEVILATFKSKTFFNDLNNFVKDDLKEILDNYRANKLSKLFLKWEQVFLDSGTDEQSVAHILNDIESARFVWVYFDDTYYQAFHGYANK